MRGRTLALLVVLSVAATAAVHAIPAAADASDLAVSDRYPQPDQSLTLTAHATPGEDVTFALDADGDFRITRDEIVAVEPANASGVATVTISLDAYSLGEGDVSVTADQASPATYPKSAWYIDDNRIVTIDASPPRFSDPGPTEFVGEESPLVHVDVDDRYQSVARESITVTLRDADGVLLDAASLAHDAVVFSDGTVRVDPAALPRPFAEGPVSVRVSAADPDGQRAATEWAFTIDTVPPRLSNLSVVDLANGNGVVADGDTVRVSVDVADANLNSVRADASAFGADTVTLSHIGGDTYAATFTVDADHAAVDGAYSLTLTATDRAENRNEARTTPLGLDTTAPTFGAPTPTDSALSDDTTPVVAVPIDDAHAVTASITIRDADGLVLSGSPGTTGITYQDGVLRVDLDAASASLADGEVTVIAEAVDADGNRATATWTFTVDATPPQVSNVSVVDAGNENGVVAPGETIVVEATVRDASLAFVSVDLDAFGVASVRLSRVQGDRYRATVTATEGGEQGSYGVSLTAVDEAGNRAEIDAGTLAFDAIGIRVTAKTPQGLVGSATANVSVSLATPVNRIDPSTLAVSARDADGIVVDGAPGDPGITYRNGTLTVVPAHANASYADGAVTITVSGADVDGNRGAASWTFTVDTRAPTISNVTITAGGDGMVMDGERVVVTAQVSDATLESVSAVATAFGAGRVPLEHHSGSTYRGTFVADLADVTAGDHRVVVSARDRVPHATAVESNTLTVRPERDASGTGGGSDGGGSGAGSGDDGSADGAGGAGGDLGGAGGGEPGGTGGDSSASADGSGRADSPGASATDDRMAVASEFVGPAAANRPPSGTDPFDRRTPRTPGRAAVGGSGAGRAAQSSQSRSHAGPSNLGGGLPSTALLVALTIGLAGYAWRREEEPGRPRL